MQLNQLWLCLIGVMLSIHYYSTLDKKMLLSQMLETFSQLSKLQGQVIEKMGLVSRWPDWLAIVMSQQGFCHWDTLLCDKIIHIYDITTGIIIRQVQNALPILNKNILWMNLLVYYKAILFSRQISHYFKHVITNREVRVRIWKVAHMNKRDLMLFC